MNVFSHILLCVSRITSYNVCYTKLLRIPALLFGMWNVGYQHFLSLGETAELWTTFLYGFTKVLPLIVVSYGVGLTIEIIIAQMRGHKVKEGFFMSGMLIPLIIPINIPL